MAGENSLRTWNIFIGKRRNWGILLTPLGTGQCQPDSFLRNLQTRGAFIAAFASEKRWMTIKKVYSDIGHWYQIFLMCVCQSLQDVKPKAQSERCASYCAIWPLSAELPMQINYRSTGSGSGSQTSIKSLTKLCSGFRPWSPSCSPAWGRSPHHSPRPPPLPPKMEFLDINLTKDSSLFLHAIQSFYWRIFKEIQTLLWF